ncbi:uncharacterized protein BKCO1_980002 [Diplodia corticola]|uniref:NACHT-NTPase and P-loop NTPases N-terminal domain-containing protein n=1 Tax=Diplodia corticola TaxID=236234 RepID=A0A1J9RN37_9PEZI|nr:uncharacterized protein BKCO1_980002 [Diplodia corticola]OJD29013.1 hypothetical protein BKCO1_980002 [Diplodia corticola]
MAEAVGIAAAAVHFVEIGTKLLIAASKLRSRLDNAPDKVKNSERSVKHLISLVQKPQTDLRPTSPTSLANFLSDDSKLEAKDILDDCTCEASELLGILNRLISKADDTFVKGKMRAFSYIKKEDEISERCKRLDDLKSYLGIWYHHQSVSLLKEQLMVTSVANAAIETLGSRVDAGFAAIAHSSQQQHTTVTVGSSRQSVRISAPGYPHSANCPQMSVDFSISPRAHQNRNSSLRGFHPGCTCERSQLVKSTSRVGPAVFTHMTTEYHERDCPCSCVYQTKDSETCVKVTLPRLFARHVELSFKGICARGGVSLYPSLRITNIVDTKTSSAFRHVAAARERVHKTLFDEPTSDLASNFINSLYEDFDFAQVSILQVILDELYMDLRKDFITGVSSVRDMCVDGTSLLQVSV